jgi:hypothetical protein
MQSFEIQQTFRRNISPPSSESKNKLSRKISRTIIALLIACYLSVLFFDAEDGGDIFLRNFG